MVLQFIVFRYWNVACLINVVATSVVGGGQWADHEIRVRFLQHADQVLKVFTGENVSLFRFVKTLRIFYFAIYVIEVPFLFLQDRCLVVFVERQRGGGNVTISGGRDSRCWACYCILVCSRRFSAAFLSISQDRGITIVFINLVVRVGRVGMRV